MPSVGQDSTGQTCTNIDLEDSQQAAKFYNNITIINKNDA